MGAFGFDDVAATADQRTGALATRPRFALPAVILKSERNKTLTRYAGSLHARYRTDEEVRAALLEANRERCKPPLHEGEVLRIAKSVCSYPPGPSAGYLRVDAQVLESPTLDLDSCGVNDKDLSRLFAREYRRRVRYVPETKGWYAFDGVRWLDGRAGGEQVAQLLMKEFVDRLDVAVMRIDDERRRTDCTKLLARYCQQVSRSKLLEDCKSELVAHVGEFDTRAELLNCSNGTIDLSTGEFRAHDPADMLTKVAGCAYDDRAGYGDWSAFLAETFGGDMELVGFLQMCAGAALAGDTTAERFYIAYGPTRTGKSTTIQPETLQEAKRSSKQASPDVARLRGMRFVECPEPPKNMPLDAALVKQWTGGDLVATRHLFGDEFAFRPCFQLWLNTNYLPNINDQTLFESGRVVAVPFTNRRAENERDPHLKARMREPGYLSGVLNWALDGLAMQGVTDGHVPEASRRATAEYATESDLMGEFIADACEVGEGLREDGARLYEAYGEWTTANGCGRLKRRRFYDELCRREGVRDAGGGTVHQKKTRHLFVGIRVAR